MYVCVNVRMHVHTHACAHACVRGHGGDILAVEKHLPTVAWQVARQLRHQTGLARPVRANQGVDFSKLYIQRDVVSGPQGTKIFDQVVHLKQGPGVHACPPLRVDLRRIKPASPLGASKTTASRNQPT